MLAEGAPGVGFGVVEIGGEEGCERKSIRAGLAKPRSQGMKVPLREYKLVSCKGEHEGREVRKYLLCPKRVPALGVGGGG